MASAFPRRLASVAIFLGLILIPVRAAGTPPADAAKEVGDLWEVTSRMSMEGMPMEMPAQTAKVCTAKEWKEPPAGMEERQKCERLSFKIEGPKVSWKVRCAGPPEMTGEGEITRNGPDAYTGQIRFTSKDGNMTMKLSGKRVGACDPGKK